MPDLGSVLLQLASAAITGRFGQAAPAKEALIYSSPRRKPGSSALNSLDSGLRRNDVLGIDQCFPKADLPELHQPGATFVTLTQHGQLRGCIGSLEAWRPLLTDVQENALAAAFRDPRFDPLTAEEWSFTRVEVSLLTAPEAMHFHDEADALAQLRPLVDGVIFTAGRRRSTFLPQVWEQLPEPREFMANLKQKAGLPASYWGSDVRLERYAVQKWKEASP